MTPAFMATDQVQARSTEDAATAPTPNGAATMALDQEALKRALLDLSPAEKLRIAGDRIRLAAKAKVVTQSSGRQGLYQTLTNPVRRCLGGQTPRRAH
jgi:hypothetical protein